MSKIITKILWVIVAVYNLYMGKEHMAIFCALMLIWTEIGMKEGK